MKIIILGAGQVGSSVAQDLAGELQNDITLVDHNPDLLQTLQERFEVRTVVGHAAHPAVLEQAGAHDADMIIALTNSDEVNIIACQVAHAVFNIPERIARIRSPEYLTHEHDLFGPQGLAVTVRISPEQLVTEYIYRVVHYPGALQVLDFANGKVQLVGVKADRDGRLIGHALKDLPKHMPGIHTRVAAIFRRGENIFPDGDTIIQADDEVFFLAASKNVRAIMSELRKPKRSIKRLILAGGGNIGTRLARALEKDHFYVKIIERNREIARRISGQLNHTVVLEGDAADAKLLQDENIENTIFCAVTNDDEANILSAMLAKDLNSPRVMALVNRPRYVELIEKSTRIDVAISPQQVTIGDLLRRVRRGDVVKVHSLRRGAAEAIEAIAHGTEKHSNVVGRRVGQLTLPEKATIGAIVRDDDVIICHHDTEIKENDHIILFLPDRRRIHDVERLFVVHALF